MADLILNPVGGGVIELPISNKANTTIKFPRKIPDYFDIYWNNDTFDTNSNGGVITLPDMTGNHAIYQYTVETSDFPEFEFCTGVYKKSDNDRESISDDILGYYIITMRTNEGTYLLTEEIIETREFKYFDGTYVETSIMSSYHGPTVGVLIIEKRMPIYIIKRP